MTTHPPADWYQDPAEPSARRFWDGEEWTALVAGGRPRPELEPAPVPAGVNALRPSAELALVSEAAPSAGVRHQEPMGDTQHCSGSGTVRADRLLTRTTTATPCPATEQTSTPRETPMVRLAKVAPAAGPSTTVTAIADLMATVDASEDEDEVEDGRTPRIVVLLVALLVALAATAGVTVTRGNEPAERTAPQVSDRAEVPASQDAGGAPVEADPSPAVADLDLLYGACQEEVKASPLSTDVRLVFQPLADILVEHLEVRTLVEFWVRKQGDPAEENRVSYACLVPDGVTVEPQLFAQL